MFGADRGQHSGGILARELREGDRLAVGYPACALAIFADLALSGLYPGGEFGVVASHCGLSGV